MNNQAHERQELARLAADLREIETAPLYERQAARDDWADALTDTPMLQERVGWLLAGSYGHGAAIQARTIVRNSRMNREAALGQLLAALEWRCPAAFARQAWRELPTPAQAAANAAISTAIADWLAADSETM